MGGLVGLLPGSFGDLGPDAMSQLVANWPGGWTAFEETAGLHSRTLHSTSFFGARKETGQFVTDVIWMNRAHIATNYVFFSSLSQFPGVDYKERSRR